jgi:acetyltransferase-like isoleucine patch superfamily enzyme
VKVAAWKEESVGRYCQIEVILDTDQHPTPGRGWDIRPVWIGDRVWVCASAVILDVVTNGDDTVARA